ncbi:hypothetical protein DZB77_24655 [Salmonella enterica]|nr:hypothetical protein [Salmonella enterica]EAW1478162.1 hypothetical protein [Salmonella enterica subsp. enterica]EBI8227523.1 hypothetical protein [Salmonella enterica]EBM4190566.1 hypothetical protein [Salmonella enterica]ECT9810485.1 hypothetical protein [Salmonella enterica]
MLIAKKIMVSFIVILTLSVHSSEIRTIKQGPDKETYFPVDMNTLVEQQNEDKKCNHILPSENPKEIFMGIIKIVHYRMRLNVIPHIGFVTRN